MTSRFRMNASQTFPAIEMVLKITHKRYGARCACSISFLFIDELVSDIQ